MHRVIPLCAAIALGFLLSASPTLAQSYLTILHLNDTHSNLAPGAPRDVDGNALAGGIARAASVIAAERTPDPNTLLLHAGDSFIGDPAYNFSMATLEQPELMLLQQLGLDAMAVGNHEFDLGAEALLGCLATSFASGGFPLLSANLDYSADPQHALQGFVLPNIIKTVGDVTVGIFGMTTPEVEQLGTAVPIAVSDDLLNIAVAQVAQLQAAGCQVIIMLSHLGYFDDFRVGTNVAGINLIVGGHDHYVLNEAAEISNTSGGKAWIVQAGAFYRAMGKTRLKVDQGAVTLDGYTLITLDQGVVELEPVKTAVTDMYALLDAEVGGLLHSTVGVATNELSEWIPDCTVDGILDTHVGNICADAYASATGADFAIQPGGSTAQPIYPGPIKALDLFRTIGYGINAENGIGFSVVTVDMTGVAVKAAVEATLMFIEANDELLLHPSDGVTITFNPAAMAGKRLISLEVNAAPIDDAATYTVALNELLVMYLDVLSGFDPTIAYTNLQTFNSSMGAGPLTELEALVGYTTAVQTLSADPLPGRVVSEVTPVDPVAGVSESPILENNYPNPFGEMTAVRFTLPTQMHTRVAVYDVIGREVAVLAEREFTPGTHSLLFHADGLPAGLYFCRLLAGGTQHTIRLLHAR